MRKILFAFVAGISFTSVLPAQAGYVHNDPINLTDPTGEYAEVTVKGNSVNVHFNFVVRKNYLAGDSSHSGNAGIGDGKAFEAKIGREIAGLNQLQQVGDYDVSFTHSVTFSEGQPPLQNSTVVQPLEGFGSGGNSYNPESDTVFLGENAQKGVGGHEFLHAAGASDQYDPNTFAPNEGFSSSNVMVNSSGRTITDSQINEIIQNPNNDVRCTGNDQC